MAILFLLLEFLPEIHGEEVVENKYFFAYFRFDVWPGIYTMAMTH